VFFMVWTESTESIENYAFIFFKHPKQKVWLRSLSIILYNDYVYIYIFDKYSFHFL